MSNIRGLFIGDAGADIERQTRAFSPIGGEILAVDALDSSIVIESLKNVDVAMADITGQFDSSIFQHMGFNGKCKGLVNLGHGYDQIDLDAATENGVIIANTASFGTEEVSNHAILLILACARKLVLHDRLMRSGKWTREHLAPQPGRYNDSSPIGHIAEQILGLIGSGYIGRATGRKARALGMHVICFDPYVPDWDLKEYGFDRADTLEELCINSDYITLHPALTPETHHIMSDKQFAAMKPSAYLVNCGRGNLVDEKALVRALRNGQIAGAGLDVFEQEPVDYNNPLLTMDNVTLTNHYASTSGKAWDIVYIQMGEEAVRIATGTWPMSLVNRDVMANLKARPPAKAWNVYAQELQQQRSQVDSP